MNRSHIVHVIVGLFIQANIWLVTGSLWLGFAFVTGMFLGREHAQFEYKLGGPTKYTRYEALAFWKWSTDAKLDLVLPAIATLIVSIGGALL